MGLNACMGRFVQNEQEQGAVIAVTASGIMLQLLSRLRADAGENTAQDSG